ncbi:MAG TPA: alpha/beta hydrolase [Anaerolineae bacterium]|nr:alpha/beta hydrolase [Anaerolineae bacterium]
MRIIMISQQAITLEGRQAKYWIGGSGKPLVLIHGGLGDAQQHWSSTFEALTPHFQVLAPDLPGFGVSAPLPMPSYQNYLNWLQLLFDMLNIGGPLLLMGHSFGAVLCRFFAAENTGYVSRLVLIDGGAVIDAPGCVRPVIRLPGVGSLWFNIARQRSYSHDGLKRALADEKLLTPDFVAKAQTASIGLAAAWRQIALTTPPALRTPTCPTLMIWGERDQFSSVENGKRIAAEINGAKFSIIPRAAHLPQIEQPAAFHQAVLPFLLSATS